MGANPWERVILLASIHHAPVDRPPFLHRFVTQCSFIKTSHPMAPYFCFFWSKFCALQHFFFKCFKIWAILKYCPNFVQFHTQWLPFFQFVQWSLFCKGNASVGAPPSLLCKYPPPLFDQTQYVSRLLLNININKRKTEKILFSLENRGETNVASLWRKNDHFDFAFSPFWCTKNFNWWLFCVENKSNNIFQTKNWMFYSFSIFPALFLQQFFPFTLYRVAYKWRMDRITYQQVND